MAKSGDKIEAVERRWAAADAAEREELEQMLRELRFESERIEDALRERKAGRLR